MDLGRLSEASELDLEIRVHPTNTVTLLTTQKSQCPDTAERISAESIMFQSQEPMPFIIHF